MLKRILFLFFGIMFCMPIMAQDDSVYSAYTIPPQLKVKANAVVRYNHKKVNVSSVKNLTTTIKRIVTVFNEYGVEDVNAVVHYNNGVSIENLEAIIYDASGNKIKKIRKSDFEDVSAVNNFSLYEDSRVKYLKYTPISYPYTVEFYCETTTNNTAYISSWNPLGGYYMSTENSKYEVEYDSSLEIKIKEQNLEQYSIINNSSEGILSYQAQNILAAKPEEYSISFRDFCPSVRVALKKFHYEGYFGETNDWNTMGKWMYDQLLKSRTVLSEDTKTKIRQLVEGVEDPIDKAKIVYNYVQGQTRYISVQEGIGGIQPEMASKVDALKYGDCKGLTNYTKALMDAVGVESYYTRVNASNSLVDVDKGFVTFVGQTNHVILNIPNENENIWLECTSQTSPFNYIANFTDDRDVFVLTPEGGKIVHTTVYKTEDNLQDTKATISFAQDGSMKADVTVKTYGYQYTLHEGIQNKPLRDQKLDLMEYWDYINNLSIAKIEYNNDKDNVIFTETAKVSSTSYATKSGKRLLIQPNTFNRVTSIPTRYKNRTLDFEIERGFIDKDEFIIKIDSSLNIEAIPDNVSISNQFGSYEFSIEKLSENELLYKRIYTLNKGYYPKQDYKSFRDFIAQIVKYDKTKIVLISKT